jgi:VanZ family protein
VTRLAIWLPPLVWMAVIVTLSTGEFSADTTGRLLGPLLAWLFPWLTPAQVDVIHGLLRKTAHVTEYAILAALWFRALARGRGMRPRLAVRLALAISVGWAFLDELHQATEPARTASAIDVMLDSVGALAVLVPARLGWPRATDVATTALLWIAAVGGAAALAVDLAAGGPGGALWLSVPVAAIALLYRWRKNVSSS